MAKAILVIDMPDNCGNCPILEYCHNNDGKSDLNIRQKWCPLKEVPNKQSYNGLDGYNDYTDGWNDCIDEITR